MLWLQPDHVCILPSSSASAPSLSPLVALSSVSAFQVPAHLKACWPIPPTPGRRHLLLMRVECLPAWAHVPALSSIWNILPPERTPLTPPPPSLLSRKTCIPREVRPGGPTPQSGQVRPGGPTPQRGQARPGVPTPQRRQARPGGSSPERSPLVRLGQVGPCPHLLRLRGVWPSGQPPWTVLSCL